MRQMAFRWPRLGRHGQAVTHGSDFPRLDNDERQQRQRGHGPLRRGASHRGQRAHRPKGADRRGAPRCRRRLADRLDTGWPDGRRTHGSGGQQQAQRWRNRLTQANGPSVSVLTSEARRSKAVLEGSIRIERLAYGRLAVLGTTQLASVRSVGRGARNAIRTSRREKALGPPFLPARSVEATVGTGLLVLNVLEQAR